MSDAFKLPEPGVTLDPLDPLREAVEAAVRGALEDAARSAEVQLGSWDREIRARAASSRGVSGIELAGMERRVRIGIDGILGQSERQATALVTGILETADRTIAEVQTSSRLLRGSVLEALHHQTDHADTQRSAMESRVRGAIEGSGDSTAAGLNSLSSDIHQKINDTQRQTLSSLSALKRTVKADQQRLSTNLDVVHSTLSTQISGAIGTSLLGTASLLSGLVGSLALVGKSVMDAGLLLTTGLATAIETSSEALLGPMWEALLSTLGIVDENGEYSTDTAPDRVLRAMDPDARGALQAWAEVQREMPDSPVLRGLIDLAIWIASGPQTVMAMLGKRAEKRLQDYAMTSPWALLPVPDLIDAWKRNLKSISDCEAEIRMQGYTAKDAKTAIALRRMVCPAGTLVDWMLRDFIPEKRVRSELKAQGYEGQDIDNYVKGAYRPPPIQDIISMAVREVFSPADRANLGLDEEYPESLSGWARKQGLADEWARNYWAAHWRLPSVQQGFQMLHRGEIDEVDLGRLLKAQDISPTWRGKLQGISYLPYTRVDLRRMYEVGEVSEGELVEGYIHLGYAPDKASKLANFAVIERKRQKAEHESRYRGLTPTQMRAAVAKELMSRNDAETELVARGYTPLAADIYLALTTKGTTRNE